MASILMLLGRIRIPAGYIALGQTLPQQANDPEEYRLQQPPKHSWNSGQTHFYSSPSFASTSTG
jgi:hypothetical protein